MPHAHLHALFPRSLSRLPSTAARCSRSALLRCSVPQCAWATGRRRRTSCTKKNTEKNGEKRRSKVPVGPRLHPPPRPIPWKLEGQVRDTPVGHERVVAASMDNRTRCPLGSEGGARSECAADAGPDFARLICSPPGEAPAATAGGLPGSRRAGPAVRDKTPAPRVDPARPNDHRGWLPVSPARDVCHTDAGHAGPLRQSRWHGCRRPSTLTSRGR